MFARVVELMLACWLALSPFIFRHGASDSLLWINDLACAAALATLSLMAFALPSSKLHLLTIVVAVWLITFAFLQPQSPPAPAYQNHVCLGLLLLIFAVVPGNAGRPPPRWEEFLRELGQ